LTNYVGMYGVVTSEFKPLESHTKRK
ncbi:MAG: hypothetical protein PWR27_2372, partial [Petroclostridium sp.]|nr:hypothetical protein [Clostridia bacterium]MDK2811378.1 hypothetical protein [Petroclostridium sp.]MDK2811461.1 hypothetical protein [Petroclostridium sp.]MDK2811663.1 hypothetical protein [Petroclostridium sp.]